MNGKALLAASLVFALSASAAEVTRVATAAEDDRPLQIDLDASFMHTRTETKITREAPGATQQLEDELTSVRTLDAFSLRLAVGIWHDLEIHAFAQVAARDVQDWNYASGVTAATSTLANNRTSISGCALAANCQTLNPIVAVPGQSSHQGLFDPTIGIAWKPINEFREVLPSGAIYPPGRPLATWALGLDYTLPLGGGLDDPSRWGANAALGAAHPAAGGESRRAHVFSLWTAFSKRYRVVEPYLRLEGDAPFAAHDAYDNCSHPELLADVAAANCAVWKGQTGYQPPFEGAMTAGFELVIAEDRENDRRFAFDLRGDLRWHGPQRGYSQATDMLGKLTYEDQYVTSMGQLSLYGRVGRFLQLRAYGLVGADSAHFITNEEVGEDKTGDGQIIVSGGSGLPAPDQNPNFDYRVDQVGRRLRAEPAVFWGVGGSLAVSF